MSRSKRHLAWALVVAAPAIFASPAAAQQATAQQATVPSTITFTVAPTTGNSTTGNSAASPNGFTYRLYKGTSDPNVAAELVAAVPPGAGSPTLTDRPAADTKPTYTVKWVGADGTEYVVGTFPNVDPTIGDLTYHFSGSNPLLPVNFYFSTPPIAGSRYRLYKFQSADAAAQGTKIGPDFVANGTNGTDKANPPLTDTLVVSANVKPLYQVRLVNSQSNVENVIFSYTVTDLSRSQDANTQMTSSRLTTFTFASPYATPGQKLQLFKMTSSADAGTQVGDALVAGDRPSVLTDVMPTPSMRPSYLRYEVRWIDSTPSTVLGSFLPDPTQGDQSFTFKGPKLFMFTPGISEPQAGYALDAFRTPAGIAPSPSPGAPVGAPPYFTVAGDIWTFRHRGPKGDSFDVYKVPDVDGPLPTYVSHPANKWLNAVITAGANPDFLLADGMQLRFQTGHGSSLTLKDVEVRPGSPKVKLITTSSRGEGDSTFTVRKSWSGAGYSFELSKTPGIYLAIRPRGAQFNLLDGMLATASINAGSSDDLKQSASFNVIPSPVGVGLVLQRADGDLLWFDSKVIGLFRFKRPFIDTIERTESLIPIIAGDSASKIAFTFPKDGRDQYGSVAGAKGVSFDFRQWKHEFQPDGGAKIPVSAWIDQKSNASFFDFNGFANHLRQGYNILSMDPLNLQDHGVESNPAPFIFLPPDAKVDYTYYTANDGARMAKDMLLSPEIRASGTETTQAYSTDNEFQTSTSASLGMEAQAGDPKSDSLSVGASGSFSQSRKDASSAGRIARIKSKWASDCWLQLNKDTAILAPDFQKALFQLAGSNDYEPYKRFFRRFGTHYAVSALFGGYATEESYLTKSGVLAELSKSATISGKTGATVDGVGGSSDASATFGSDAVSNVTTESEYARKLSFGGGGEPSSKASYVPLKANLRPIYELAFSELLSSTPDSTPTLLDAQNLTGTRTRMKEMLTRYLDQEADDLFFYDRTLVVVVVTVDSLKCTYGSDQYNTNIAQNFAYADDVFGSLAVTILNDDTGEPMNFDGTPYVAAQTPPLQLLKLWDEPDSTDRNNFKQVDASMGPMTIGQTCNAPMMVEKTLQTKKDGQKAWFASLQGQTIRIHSFIQDNDGSPGDQNISFDGDGAGDLDLSGLEKLGTKSYDLAMKGEDGSTFTLKVTATLKTLRDPGPLMNDLPPFPNYDAKSAATPMPADRSKSPYHDRYTLRDPDLYGNKALALREWHYGDWELVDRAAGTVLVAYKRSKEKHSKDGSRVDPQKPFTLTSGDAALTVLTVAPGSLQVNGGTKAGKSYTLWDQDAVRYDPSFTKPAPLRGSGAIYLRQQADGAWVVRWMTDANASSLWFPADGKDAVPGSAVTFSRPGWNKHGLSTVWTWSIPASIPPDGVMTKITSTEQETQDFLRVLPPAAP